MLKAGVAGAGVFGGYHANKLSAVEGVSLARIYDADLARAQALTARFGGEAFDDLATFLDGLDTVTVATPADSHADIALKAIAANAHVYVEKPLASTLEEADTLAAAVSKAGRVGACGHQERVTFAAMGLLDAAERPLALTSIRRGLPNQRARDVSCVLDLMIHDLDLALLLSGGEAVAVEAEGGFDMVKAEVVFSNGLVATFQSSREATARERMMTLDYASGEVRVDFLQPSFDNRSTVSLDPGFAETSTGRDPLGVSVARFIAAVRGQGSPVADFTAGARALDLAFAVESAAGL